MSDPDQKRHGQPGWWVLSALLLGLIWLFSSRGSTPVPTPHPFNWLAHLLTYLALAFCLGRATGNWLAALLLAAWFGALDEVHQAFVPPREAGLGDWWFDLAGAWLGARLAFRTQQETQKVVEPVPQVDLEF